MLVEIMLTKCIVNFVEGQLVQMSMGSFSEDVGSAGINLNLQYCCQLNSTQLLTHCHRQPKIHNLGS